MDTNPPHLSITISRLTAAGGICAGVNGRLKPGDSDQAASQCAISLFDSQATDTVFSIPPYPQELKPRHHIEGHRSVILPVLFAALLSIGTSAWSQVRASDASKPCDDWQITLGAGALVAPEYEGSTEYTVYPIPYFSIIWKDHVFLNLEHGIGLYAYNDDRLQLAVSVEYARGRHEGDSDRLRGLGHIDDTARGHLFARFSLGSLTLGLDLAQDLGGTDGFQVRPNIGLTFALSEKVRLSPEVSVTWANDEYMQYYFGISPAQASRSGLRRFDSGAGFKRVDLRFAATWVIKDRWFTTANIRLGYLLGDAADSPIADRRFQPSVGSFVGYRF